MGKRQVKPDKQAPKRVVSDREHQKSKERASKYRKADEKARRRQWDPPRQVVDVSPEPKSNGTDCSDDTHHALTSAELFALGVLTEIGAGSAEDDAKICALMEEHVIAVNACMPGDNCSGTPPNDINSIIAMGDQLSSRSSGATPSANSSTEAIQRFRMDSFQESVNIYDDIHQESAWHTGPLPPYVSPSVQSRQHYLLREVGKVGPLTTVQRYQMHVQRLSEPVTEKRARKWLKANPEPLTPMRSTISWERACVIDAWQSHPGFLTDWDIETRREFAEAALQIRIL
ncbi:hypothetical protein FB45DRAFT_868665 [Roridomyces roridus]|uniref:Uncharacterized protein n=1 Tax=Roridomyces roridus TaxID=1738132 RepID=A0AAD7BQR8_9AGAR|nr:hypothetical protein FB45DRAFT_868665 [Roridomyces roridus]